MHTLIGGVGVLWVANLSVHTVHILHAGLACKSSGIYPVDCFQQGARTSRFGAKPPAPQFYKVATTLR